jgi:hypothetical protein
VAERALFRLGAAATVSGSLLAFVFNAIHPRGFDFDRFVESFLRSAANRRGAGRDWVGRDLTSQPDFVVRPKV